MVLQDSVHDTSYVATHTRDTIYLTAETDAIILTDTVFKTDTVLIKTRNGLTATVRVKAGKAIFICKEDSVRQVNDSLILVNKRTETITKIIEVNVLTPFQKWRLNFFWVLVAILVGAAIWKYIKPI